jgi:hypothetical protein
MQFLNLRRSSAWTHSTDSAFLSQVGSSTLTLQQAYVA